MRIVNDISGRMAVRGVPMGGFCISGGGLSVALVVELILVEVPSSIS